MTPLLTIRKTITASAIAAAILHAAAAGAQQAPDTLASVVEQAILNHPEVQARYHDFQSALEGQEIARGAYRPEVNVQGWVGREYRSGGTGPSDWNRTGYSLELRQLLFNGFRTRNNVEQYGFEKLAKYFDLQSTVDSTATEAVLAYLDVQRYRELGRLAQENYAMHNGIFDLINERSQSGVGRRVDADQASGRLALAQSNWMVEAGNLLDVEERYRRITGQPPAAELAPAPDVSSRLPDSATDFSDPVRSNPGFLSKQALVRAAYAGNESAKGNFSPTLELRASTGADRDYVDRQHHIQSSRIQLLLNYNLYRGNADQARLRQTAAQMYAARDVRNYTCRNIQQELAIAWNNIVRLREQINFLRTHRDATAKVRDGYRQQFRIGQRSLMDLLNTEGELFDAQRSLVAGQYDLAAAQYKWLSLAHRILPALQLADPQRENQPDELDDLITEDVPLELCSTQTADARRLAPENVRLSTASGTPSTARPEIR
ncbi:Outer membrane efflux protein BepC precursor [Pigmentiphaga humi]|uniref:Outer membrane efflux protein BepC n=1 Tax=Pigmentiphaga humi TaxID=2478468 RepID=A0A3P4AZ03_9BURK|nr:TolC family outer membrane protein [Pigmentiphaga humi]VCU69257.1 Outer membrane efflux protein BepC precursor [Pigmentiphaga humi]